LPDFDVDFYAKKWGKEDQIKGLTSAYPERRKRNTAVRHVSDATKMKQKQTRDANKVKKAMEELRGLSDNDLRGKALKEQIIAAYHALQPDPPSTD
jgi:peroxiredoxin